LVRSEADAASGLTHQLDSRSILGTADYVAPEQTVDSSNVDIRADLYSLGATLYFLLAGRPLFTEGRTAQKLVWQQMRDPVPLTRLRADVPPELANVIHQLLQKRPEKRIQTPAELFDALAPWTHDEIPLPDEALMPRPPLRVLATRSASPSSSAPRVSGSTSQILALAMRTGSGSVGQSATHRSAASGGGSGDKHGSSVIPTPGPRTGNAKPAAETDALQREETQLTPTRPTRIPRPDVPAEGPARRKSGRWPQAPLIVAITTAVVALALLIVLIIAG